MSGARFAKARLANRLVSSTKYGAEGGAMCDEYYDARMKAFWRALADESEEELDEEKEIETPKPIVIDTLELPKAKPRALVR